MTARTVSLLKATALHGVLLGLLALTMAPLAVMLMLSLKTNSEIFAGFWSLPASFHWDHYTKAWVAVDRYLANSILICTVSCAGVLALSSMAGYAFARHDFPFRRTLFAAVLGLMMVPGVLTLIPQFLLVKNLGLLNTRWALVLPYIAGGQVFGILLFRAFFEDMPKDLLEAARIDGAGEWTVYSRIVMPLALPVVATVGIMTAFGVYNDFIWPLVAISDPTKQVFTVALRIFTAENDLEMGPTLAGYALGCVPMILLIGFGMRYFVQGVTSGAVKA